MPDTAYQREVMQPLPRYVLITPARNEAQFIELTIESVVVQSIQPLKWVIVSDGSTDGTDDIVTRYASQYPWIELHRVGSEQQRNFAAKVNAFNAGYQRLKHLEYEAIGSLDADLSFDPDYFSFLLGQLASEPDLGLVGTPFVENGGQTYDYRFVSRSHVSGACQLFRRSCFEDIGGYVPIRGGGIDRVAVLKARARGWATLTFTEKRLVHHRKMGTGTGGGAIAASFKQGKKDYSFGNHPLWEVFRGTYQITQLRPYVVGGMALLSGYAWAAATRLERPISRDLVAFQRQEQIDRLKALFTRRKPSPDREASSRRAQIDCGRS